MDADSVFKALGNESRRKLLDVLCENNGQTLGEMCEHLNTSRQAVMKHLAIVRSVSTQDNSHSAGVDRIQRGDPKNRGVVYTFFGSAVAKLVGPNDSGLPPYIWVKPMSGGFIDKASKR